MTSDMRKPETGVGTWNQRKCQYEPAPVSEWKAPDWFFHKAFQTNRNRLPPNKRGWMGVVV